MVVVAGADMLSAISSALRFVMFWIFENCVLSALAFPARHKHVIVFGKVEIVGPVVDLFEMRCNALLVQRNTNVGTIKFPCDKARNLARCFVFPKLFEHLLETRLLAV